MRVHGHTITWETPTDVGRARRTRGWPQPLRDWWVNHRAARRQAQVAAYERRWDARREAPRPRPGEAALALVTRLYGLSL
jgi:hypothetical protein